MNGASYGSSIQARAKVAPSLGAILSVTKKIHENKIYFTYQQEMKSNFHVQASGDISNPFPLSFDSSIDSVIFYDPHTFRFGGNYIFSAYQLFFGLEYQLWSGYKSPLIILKKNSGVIISSSDYEILSTRDTLNPRIGLKHNLTDRWSYSLGYTFRQTPLKGNFSGSGNSIDSDTSIFTGGFQYRMVIWSKDVHLGTSFEYHQLKTSEVIKTANEENGNAGTKIGSPGYTIGGQVLAGSFGIKFNF
jgi:long-subunit fatty acid transport protein